MRYGNAPAGGPATANTRIRGGPALPLDPRKPIKAPLGGANAASLEARVEWRAGLVEHAAPPADRERSDPGDRARAAAPRVFPAEQPRNGDFPGRQSQDGRSGL